MTLTLKKRLKNAGILTAVFIVAVIIFVYNERYTKSERGMTT